MKIVLLLLTCLVISGCSQGSMAHEDVRIDYKDYGNILYVVMTAGQTTQNHEKGLKIEWRFGYKQNGEYQKVTYAYTPPDGSKEIPVNCVFYRGNSAKAEGLALTDDLAPEFVSMFSDNQWALVTGERRNAVNNAFRMATKLSLEPQSIKASEMRMVLFKDFNQVEKLPPQK